MRGGRRDAYAGPVVENHKVARGERAMSTTIAHRPHVHHLPLAPVIAVIAVALIAAVVIWAINQPETGTTTTTVGTTVVAPVVHPAAVAAPETLALRRALLLVHSEGVDPSAYAVARRHMVEGTTLDPVRGRPHRTAP